MKRHVLEFLGTFLVVLAISLTENPMAIGLMYLAVLYVGTRISGAHYNPGITLAMWLRGEFSTHRIWGYWIAQLLGAFAALYLTGFVHDLSRSRLSWTHRDQRRGGKALQSAARRLAFRE